MKQIFKILLALNFLFLMLPKAYNQVHPSWFDKVGVYRTWMPTQVRTEFDSKVRTSGIPAWGHGMSTIWTNPDQTREDVDYTHNLGRFYVANTLYSNMSKDYTIYYEVDSIAARTIDGKIIEDPEKIQVSLCSPTWKKVLKSHLKKMIDVGSDGVFYDDMRDMWYLAGSFDRYTLGNFRNYLNEKYTSTELMVLFDILDINSFNYADWIRNHGQENNWQDLPLDGLKEEFWIFNYIADRKFFKELADSIKDYALRTYGKEITISDNAFFAATSDFEIHFDMIDYSVGEFVYFNKKYVRTINPDNYYYGTDVFDFMAIANKVRRSVRSWPTLPLVSLAGVGTLNYPKQTKNLIKLIFADAYASQGAVHLEEGFAGKGIEGGPNVISYDWDIAGRYSNFLYNNFTLFENLAFKPHCGLLYSVSSLNPKSDQETNGFCIKSFYGTGQFLIDHSIPFDVIYAPEIRLSTLPEISLEKFEQYKTVILPNTMNLNDNQVQVILNYVQTGGTILALGDIGIKGEDGHLVSRPELESLQTENGENTLGLGKFVYFREERSFGTEYGTFYWANPNENDAEFYNFLKPYIDPELIISGTDSVSGFIYQNSINNNTIIHLVNYSYDIPTDQFFLKENFTIKVQVDTLKLWEAVYVSPDFIGQQILPTYNDTGYIMITIPKLEAYGIVILQQNEAAPQIIFRSPSEDVMILAGDSLRFSVFARDPDNNPLFYQWYINGLMDSLGTDSTYIFKSSHASSGVDTIRVEVSDGSHKVDTEWLVTIQPYTYPKIIFDETHNQHFSPRLSRAIELLIAEEGENYDTNHIEWVLCDKLINKLCKDYTVTSDTTEPLLLPTLQEADVLFLVPFRIDLSSEERTGIRDFIAQGGNLLILGISGWWQANEVSNGNLYRLLRDLGFKTYLPNVWSLDDTLWSSSVFMVDLVRSHPATSFAGKIQVESGHKLETTTDFAKIIETTRDLRVWEDINNNGIRDPNEPLQSDVGIIGISEYGEGKAVYISTYMIANDRVDSPTQDVIVSVMKWLTADVNPVVSVEREEIIIPESFDLSQNYPNPFNPTTTIRFQLPKHSKVSIKIYDIIGQEVRTLVEKDFEAGYHTVTWDGSNNSERKVASGIYFYRIETEGFIKVKKALLLK